MKRNKNHHGSGSVSRRLRYAERIEADQEFRKKVLEASRKNNLRRAKRFNKRCVDCNKLISPASTRCRSCESTRKINETWKRRRKQGK